MKKAFLLALSVPLLITACMAADDKPDPEGVSASATIPETVYNSIKNKTQVTEENQTINNTTSGGPLT